MPLLFLIGIILPFVTASQHEQIKTSITNPLFLVRSPVAEAVAIANEYIVQIYARKQVSSNFNLPYFKNHVDKDAVTKLGYIPASTVLNKQQIIQNLRQNERVSRQKDAVYSYRLNKHIISEQPITGLYWGSKIFMVQTNSAISVYNAQTLALNFNYKVTQKALAMTSIKTSLYFLFQHATEKDSLSQIMFIFENRSCVIKEVIIQLPQRYKFYEYFMGDYEWLYLVNQTHVQLYDILNKKIRNSISSNFEHAITRFQVDESDNLAIASNEYGDYLFINFNQTLLAVKNTNYHYAAFCSHSFVVIGNQRQFQVMQVDQKYLSSQEQFQSKDIRHIQCSFSKDLNIIYTIDSNGYLGVFLYKESGYFVFWTIVIILLTTIIIGALRKRESWSIQYN